MIERITFLTIGQSPRTDLVPEIVSALPDRVEVAERGALDGLADEEIAGLRPAVDDRALVTRLRDGRSAVIGKRWVTGRVQELLDEVGASTELGAERTGATVLLCTGDFPTLSARGLFVDAQRVVDHGVDALCHGADRVGLLVPLARQEAEHHYAPRSGQCLETAHASPYDDGDFAEAGRALAGCDVIVMHCMGYTEAQRAVVARSAGRPVLLARRLVASALAQLL